MALPAKDLQRLLEMQKLSDRVIEKTEAVERALKLLRSLEKDVEKLGALYEDHWLDIVSDKRMNKADQAAIENATAEGRYTVLGQDTIWNALEDSRRVRVSMLKTLVAKL